MFKDLFQNSLKSIQDLLYQESSRKKKYSIFAMSGIVKKKLKLQLFRRDTYYIISILFKLQFT